MQSSHKALSLISSNVSWTCLWPALINTADLSSSSCALCRFVLLRLPLSIDPYFYFTSIWFSLLLDFPGAGTFATLFLSLYSVLRCCSLCVDTKGTCTCFKKSIACSKAVTKINRIRCSLHVDTSLATPSNSWHPPTLTCSDTGGIQDCRCS